MTTRGNQPGDSGRRFPRDVILFIVIRGPLKLTVDQDLALSRHVFPIKGHLPNSVIIKATFKHTVMTILSPSSLLLSYPVPHNKIKRV